MYAVTLPARPRICASTVRAAVNKSTTADVKHIVLDAGHGEINGAKFVID
jgi:hypothetical protein